MEAKIYFSETQRFTQWWLWAILLGAASMPVFGLIKELRTAHPFSDAAHNASIFISLIIMASVWVLFLLLRLETQITDAGITVRFFPFHLKSLHFPWAETEQVYVREYSPLGEFGGWGLRYGLDVQAYNVSGNQWIQIVFKDGKKLLIGTNKPAEAAAALKQSREVAR